MKIDHHVHTSIHSPDSVITPEALIESARDAGLDGVVITEHDYQWDAEELFEIQQRARDLLILSGAEISTREGHFLVYGLPDLADTPPGISIRELIRVVRDHDAAIVAAHPFRWDQDFRSIIEEFGPAFDALELVSNNITTRTRRETEALLDEYPMGRTGSSDGHASDVVGCYYTRFDRTIRSVRDLIAALKGREGTPGHRQGVALASGPV